MGALTPSRVNAAPGYYSVEWTVAGWEVGFEADRLRAHSDGRLQAQVRVTAQRPGGERATLSQEQLNLTAGQSRRGLSQRLNVRHPLEGEIWDQLVEGSCRLVLERESQGIQVRRLTATEKLTPDYLMDSLILDSVANLVFAPGGSGKSYLGLYLALLVENGLTLDLRPGRQANVLFLDYETSEQEVGRRSTLLINGLARCRVDSTLRHPLYGRGLGTLADRASDLARVMAEHDIGLVVVDSAGAAAGGDILTAETAVRFFEAVRTITAATNAAALVFSHVTGAASQQDDAHRSPFGSVFFTNLSRLVWELRSAETGREDVLEVGLFARKCNTGKPAPLGFRFTFGPDAVAAEQCGAKDVTTEQGATRDLILAELSAGQATIPELVKATGAKDSTVRWHLMKLTDAGRVGRVDRGVYRLAEGRS